MILADKIITLRKKNGWSQEELADKLNVTRQSVSKWEGAQSVPDLERILQLSKVFGVSTDYLLRDELEEEEYTGDVEATGAEPVRKVSMEEANAFLAVKKKTANWIAIACSLFILSPVAMFLLAGAVEANLISISENAAGGIGMCILLLLVGAGVAICIISGTKTEEYNYLEKELFETEYGVTGMVKERIKQYRPTYVKYHVLGTIFCILAVMPLFLCVIFTENEFALVCMLALMFLLVAVGVILFTIAGINNASMQKLLQEGDYSKDAKRDRKSGIGAVYWPIVTAVYLAYSFITMDWGRSWIVWPVAGVLFAAVKAIYNMIKNNDTTQ